MKRLIFILTGLILLAGCKKAVEKKAEDAILKAMTDGQWAITSFTINGTDITSDFTAYKFQYFDNYTVNAINNGTVEKTGTWLGDVNTMNISADFPNATNPLLLINGTWHITDNSWTYVKATMTVGSELRTLRLDKQ
jgi:exonuclease III